MPNPKSVTTKQTVKANLADIFIAGFLRASKVLTFIMTSQIINVLGGKA